MILIKFGVKLKKVRIMSMHAAKGLEFETVFLAGLDDGIVPFVGIDVLTGNFSGGGGDRY